MRKFFQKDRDREGRPRRPRRNELEQIRKKFCRFCQEKVKFIDYKDLKRLEKFVTMRGKILSSRISGNCAKHQRKIAVAVKRARYIGLLPFERF